MGAINIGMNSLGAVNSIASANGVASSATGLPGTAGSSQTAATPQPFQELFTDSVSQVNQLEETANTAITGLITGSGVDVHQAMIATGKANMAFELALAVRNKAVQAYQSVIGMQF